MKELPIKIDFSQAEATSAALCLTMDTGQEVRLDLSQTQGAVVMEALGIMFESTAYDEYEDQYLAEWIRPLLTYMDVEEAASRLGISARRIRKLCETGDLDAGKEEGEWLITRESVELRRKKPLLQGKPAHKKK